MKQLKFHSRLVPSIIDGRKTQTIRRNTDCKQGESVPLYSGPRFIREVVVARVQRVFIDTHAICVAGETLRSDELDTFVKAEGFDDVNDLKKFVRSRYGLPVNGVVIEW